MKASALIGLITLLSCRASAPPIRTYDFSKGEQVIQAMRDRYVGRWYQTLTAVQYNRIPQAGGAASSIWLDAYMLPSRMRIDFVPKEQGNGVLILADTQYVVRSAESTDWIARTNPVLLLGFDVYFLSVSQTLARLRQLGFDVNRAREDVWMNRPVLVVGANAGDDRSPQFWIDRENLVLVRLIDPSGAARPRGTDFHFTDFQKLGYAWLPRRVRVFENKRLISDEEYRQVRSNVALDSALFELSQWQTAMHWYQLPVEPHRGCC